MNKQLKDYIHFYIGCKVEWGFEGQKKIGILSGLDKRYGWQVFDPTNIIAPYRYVRIELIMPVLRRMESMTEDEDQRQFREANRGHYIDMHWYPEGFAWLLEKRFDLFGLIDAGLAIDAATLNNKTAPEGDK